MLIDTASHNGCTLTKSHSIVHDSIELVLDMPALISSDGSRDGSDVAPVKQSLDAECKTDLGVRDPASQAPASDQNAVTGARKSGLLSSAQTNGGSKHVIPRDSQIDTPPVYSDLPLRQLTDGTRWPHGASVESLGRYRTSEDSTTDRSMRNGYSSRPAALRSAHSSDSQHGSTTSLAGQKSHILSLALSNNNTYSITNASTNALTPVDESSAAPSRSKSRDSSSMLQVPNHIPPPRPSTPPPDPGATASVAGSPPSVIPPSPAQQRHPPGRRRGSVQLVRRVTRSLASDLHLDDMPQDEDAARWAERIKQRRISTKRKRDDDEDRVVMGTKVDEGHVNYITAYNMLTGIRFCVSRTNAKMDRELTDADFVTCHKFAFDVTGNELTPSSRYDFKFKDYAPWVFRHLRGIFRIDPADYLMSLTDRYILSELGSPGKSGSFFYFSRDYKYIIKTVHHSEAKFLRKVLREYYNHVRANPNTLLSEFYGLHRVKMPFGRKIHFVVMNNLFPPHKDIHRTFDLKGSTIGREYPEDQLVANPRATLKDLNWNKRNMHLEFGPIKARAFIEQMQRDVALLRRLQIMDYSLLVGIHDLGRGNRENLRDKTLQVFEPGGERTGAGVDGWTMSMPAGERSSMSTNIQFDQSAVSSAPPHQLSHITSQPQTANPPMSATGHRDSTHGSTMARDSTALVRTPSKIETARNAKELRQLVRAERPVPMDQTDARLPEIMLEEREGYFYADNGGFAATHGDNSLGEEIYYLGIIDCLTKVRETWRLLRETDKVFK